MSHNEIANENANTNAKVITQNVNVHLLIYFCGVDKHERKVLNFIFFFLNRVYEPLTGIVNPPLKRALHYIKLNIKDWISTWWLNVTLRDNLISPQIAEKHLKFQNSIFL